MEISRAQAVLSVIVMGAFVATTSIIALTPVIGGYPPDSYTEHLKTFSSLYSGITGLIIGYYFGKGTGKR